MRGKRKGLKAACLAVGLAAAWGMSGGNAEAAQVVGGYNLVGDVSPDFDLSHVFIYYSFNSSGYAWEIQSHFMGSVPGETSTPFSFPLNYDPTTWWGDSTSYSVFGLYDSDANGDPDGVTVGVNDAYAGDAIGLGAAWSDLFYYDDEATIITALLEDDTVILDSFFDAIVGAYGTAGTPGEAITLVNFSTATFGGTAFGEEVAVPLPSALVLLFPSLAGLLLARRRKK